MDFLMVEMDSTSSKYPMEPKIQRFGSYTRSFYESLPDFIKIALEKEQIDNKFCQVVIATSFTKSYEKNNEVYMIFNEYVI